MYYQETIGGSYQGLLSTYARKPVTQTALSLGPSAGDGSAWEAEVANRLSQLLQLPSGWDGYRAAPIRPGACDYAISVLARLMAAGGLPTPSIVPLAYGAVQIEWHRRGWNIEVEVERPNMISVFARSLTSNKEYSFTITTDLSPLIGIVNNIRD